MRIITETDRLIIRELCREDFENVYTLNSDPEVMKYHYADGKIRTFEQEANIYKNILKSYLHNKNYGIWCVITKKDNSFIGVTSLLPNKETGELQAGVRIKKASWNNGFGSEIMKGIIDYGIFNLKLSRIVAFTNLDNYASIKALKKAGFEWEKKIKQNEIEMNYYSINKFKIS